MLLVSEFGHVQPEAGFALVLSASFGYPHDLGETKKPEKVYTVLLSGIIEEGVSGKWLASSPEQTCIFKIE